MDYTFDNSCYTIYTIRESTCRVYAYSCVNLSPLFAPSALLLLSLFATCVLCRQYLLIDLNNPLIQKILAVVLRHLAVRAHHHHIAEPLECHDLTRIRVRLARENLDRLQPVAVRQLELLRPAFFLSHDAPHGDVAVGARDLDLEVALVALVLNPRVATERVERLVRLCGA